MSSPLRNTRLQLMLAIGLLTASSFAVWGWTRYQPRMKEIADLVDHETRLRNSNQQARRAVAALGLDRIRAMIEAYDRQAEHVATLVPEAGTAETVASLLSRLAEDHAVRLDVVEPASTDRQGDFLRERVRVRAVGSYHDLGAFVSALLSGSRVLQVRDAELRAVDPVPFVAVDSVPSIWMGQIQFTLVAFTVPTDSEEAGT